MVLEELNITMSDVFTYVSGAILERVTWLATLIKAVGIFAIIYIIYLVVKAGRDIKMRSRIKAIDKKMDSVNDKLDLILGSGSKKKVVTEKIDEKLDLKEEKKSIFDRIREWGAARFKKSDKEIESSKKKVVVAKSRTLKKSKK